MRIILACLVLAIALPSLSSCNSDPNSPALQAMIAPNSCGPGGTTDPNGCGSRY